MADKRVGGVRMQDWIGIALVAAGMGLLVWFSWDADPIVKLGAIGVLAAAIVGGGYLAMRRVSSRQ